MFEDWSVDLSVIVGVLISLVVAVITALFNTRTFVEFLEQYILNGLPHSVSQEDIDLINSYVESEEIRINKVLRKQPKLVFQPYKNCPEISNDIVEEEAKLLHNKQLKDGYPDDPHAFYFANSDTEKPQFGENDGLGVFAIGKYSELCTIPKTKKDRVLVIGANNLVLSQKANKFVFHLRGRSETRSNTLHGFGGGYMPYYRNDEHEGEKTITVRRDDCKNLRFTAMRELHEESGMLCLNHIKNFVCAIEERHTKYKNDKGVLDPKGKFGYLTFFYVTIFDGHKEQTYNGDGKEGVSMEADINFSNLMKIIEHKKYENIKVHPQLRAMLLLWFFAGCPGINIFRRRLISSDSNKKIMRKLLAA